MVWMHFAGSPQGDGAGRITFQDWGIFQNPGGQPWQCPLHEENLDMDQHKSTINTFADAPHPHLSEPDATEEPHWKASTHSLSLHAALSTLSNKSLYSSNANTEARVHSEADPMLRFAASESLLNCFSWAAQTQGLLNQTLQGADILGQFAKTDAWWAVVPQLASDYPNQSLALHLWDPTLPHTSIHAKRGLITSGTGRVSFHLASEPSMLEGSSNPLGKELFALEVGAAVTVTRLELNPDDSLCPGGLRVDSAVQVTPAPSFFPPRQQTASSVLHAWACMSVSGDMEYKPGWFRAMGSPGCQGRDGLSVKPSLVGISSRLMCLVTACRARA